MNDPEYMYKDSVGRLARLVEAELSRLEVIHNFDHGAEFEVALCRLLRSALPDRYGVCRGYVVTADNQVAGDDIIIFDRDGSPTLRMLTPEDYSRKEYVPVESVYAYIEAKHTVHLDGDGPSSISRACEQVAGVKRLPRKPRPHEEIVDDFTLATKLLTVEVGGLNHPTIQNPMFGAFFARYVAWGGTRRGAADLPARPEFSLGAEVTSRPDLAVIGNDMIGFPVVHVGPAIMLRLFRDQKVSDTHLFLIPGRALALGIISLIHALQVIRLGHIDWRSVITEQLNRRTV